MAKKQIYTSKELIYGLFDLCSDRQFKKPKPLPKFTLKEVLFIRDLIFQRPKDLIFYYLADNISDLIGVRNLGLFDHRGYRKYLFFKNFLIHNGNATKAAIASGYSPRSAKQQGHRVLRQIQSYSRNRTN